MTLGLIVLFNSKMREFGCLILRYTMDKHVPR